MTTEPRVLIRPSSADDLPAITAIYGWNVLNGTGTFELDADAKATRPRRRHLAGRGAAMSPPGRPKGEYRSAERDGCLMNADRRGDRSKTFATWLAVLGGTLGLHRFYLHGFGDRWGWLLWLPTLAGAYGVQRMRALGQDDQLAWVLMPLLGLALAATMLAAIVYGLMPDDKWNARFNPGGSAPSVPWLNVLGAIAALAFGATALMASIAFVAQRYFEHQAELRSSVAAPPQSNSQRLKP